MLINVYAIREEQPVDTHAYDLAVLGYPVRYSLDPAPGAVMLSMYVADRSKVWMEDGWIYINEGNGSGFLTTYDNKLTMSIPGYYGPTRKSLRIMDAKPVEEATK